MSLEVAAAAVLAAGYLDARWLLGKDLRTMKSAVGGIVNLALNIYRERVNCFLVLEDWAESQPNEVCIVYPEPRKGAKARFVNGVLQNGDELFDVKTYTYKQVVEYARQYSYVLYHEYGIRSGDRVAMDFVNKDHFVFLWMALWNLGAVPAFINYNLQNKALAHCVTAADSKLFLVDDEVRDNGLEIAPELKDKGVPTVVVDDDFKSKVFNSPQLTVDNKQRGVPLLKDASCYIYTSGTTGLPKAGIMSWRKMQASRVYAATTFLKHDDILYSAMPLYHSTASVLGFMASIHIGAGYAIGHKFSTTTFWTQVKLSGATAIQYVGETGRYLFNAPYSPDERAHRVRQAMGNGLRPDIWAKFKERFNISTVSEFYGATELPIAINNHQEGDFGIGACASYGKLLGGIFNRKVCQIFRVDPDTQELWRDPKTGLCTPAASNEPGELLFKVDAKDISAQFQGYAGNQKATDEKIARNIVSKDDAWIRSGDLLRWDAGTNAYYFVDRLGDTFRWKSENVSTNEVEEALTEYPGIKQVVCVGVKVPNHEGRAGFAVVELKEEGKLPDLKGLAQHVTSRLPRYAIPIFVKFVNEIATTGNNKTQKKSFRSQKIPSESEDIYWLQDNEYKLLTHDGWGAVESGKVKL